MQKFQIVKWEHVEKSGSKKHVNSKNSAVKIVKIASVMSKIFCKLSQKHLKNRNKLYKVITEKVLEV